MIPWQVFGAAGLLAAILLGVAGFAHYERRQGAQECRRDTQVAMAEEFRRHTDAVAEVANEAQRMAARAVADRVRLAGASDRLRGALAGSGITIRTPAAAASAPATDPAGMCADMLGAAGERLRILAATADERGTAGTACERAYDEVSR